LILGIGDPLIGRLLLYDALEMKVEFVKLRKNPHCKVCGENPEVTTLIDYEAFCGVSVGDAGEGTAGKDWDITPRELKEALERGAPIHLIDVREPHELEISHLEGATLIPLGELASTMPELDKEENIVLFCRAGTRSAHALEMLAGAGFRHVRNLKGGIIAWAREVDTDLAVY